MRGPGTTPWPTARSLLTAVNGNAIASGRGVRRGRDGHLLLSEQRQLGFERHPRHAHRCHRGHDSDVSFFKMNVNVPFCAHRMSWRPQGQ
jgi:hypothetical protein